MIHYIEESQLTSEVIKTNKLVIALFMVENSNPCYLQFNTLVEVEKKYYEKVEIFKINFDASDLLPIRYHIFSTPTVLFFKDGKEIERVTGYTEFSQLCQIIEDCI